jgi:hypothetical protein
MASMEISNLLRLTQWHFHFRKLSICIPQIAVVDHGEAVICVIPQPINVLATVITTNMELHAQHVIQIVLLALALVLKSASLVFLI